MFAISWDALIVDGITALLALYLLAQLALRWNAMQLLEAWRLARRQVLDEQRASDTEKVSRGYAKPTARPGRQAS